MDLIDYDEIECGYSKLFQVQEQALIPIFDNQDDVYLESPTGSGKTVLAVISVLQLIDPVVKKCQALILCPTRERTQIAKEMAMKIGQRMGLKVAEIVGGRPINDQEKMLKDGASLVIGTPGRTYDLFEREILKLKHLKLLIVSECNVMIDVGFEEELRRIVKSVAHDVQMCIFSSSCPAEVRKFNDLCLRDPVYISKYRPSGEMKNFEHFKFVVGKEEEKVDFLIRLYNEMGIMEIGTSTKSIIYCKKIEDIERLIKVLQERKFNVVRIVKEKFNKEYLN